MNPEPARRVGVGVSLATVLAATFVTLSLGYALKAPCTAGNWSDGRQYKIVCYTDVVPLFGGEQLQGNRLPYLDACAPSAGRCDEYPVLTMYLMRTSAWLAQPFGSTYQRFFEANALLLAALAFVVAWALYRAVGEKALFFSLAPTLVIYAFMNWDLLAVALATVATLAFFRERDGWSGALLGLGAAAKGYPALLVLPFALDRWRQGRRKEAALLCGAAAGTWLAVNLPFAAAAPHSWGTFFQFNAQRGADWDSLWFVACDRVGANGGSCSWQAGTINVASFAIFLALTVLVWELRRHRLRETRAWTLGFPVIALFLLTNKVYSPQYGLWLLPWFALALPNLRLFVAFEVADVAVFVTRFSWFGHLAAQSGDPAFAGYSGLPIRAFEIAILVRALILAGCVVAWVVRDPPTLSIAETMSWRLERSVVERRP
jgi:uncharacterized membrane protein